MKIPKFQLFIAVGLIALFASQVYAADIDTKSATTGISDPDKVSADDVLSFFGGTHMRLYSKYFEGGTEPWSVCIKMRATLGVTADMGAVFMGLTLETGTPDITSPGSCDATSNQIEYNFLSDLNTVFKNAYAIWRAHDTFQLAMGRFPWIIDNNKKMYVYRSDLTFDSDYMLDTIGFFPVFYNKDNTIFSMSGILAYLGKYLPAPPVPVEHPGYRHFLMISLQPKVDMKLEMMDLMLGAGLWAITHPNDLDDAGISTTSYGTDVFGTNKDANLVMFEMFVKMTVDKLSLYLHTMYNAGAEEQNFGALIGFYFGSKKKTGDIGFGACLFYVEKYAWLDIFPSATLGMDQKGLQFKFDWMFFQNMTFYAQCTFKNQIADNDESTGQIYIKTGVQVKFSLKPKK